MPTRKQLAEADEMIARANAIMDDVNAKLAETRRLHEFHRTESGIVNEALGNHAALGGEIARLQAQQLQQERTANTAIESMRELAAKSSAIMVEVDEKIAEHKALTVAIEARLKGRKPS